MEFALLGWAEADPTVRLDYRRFSYAGKFVTGGTGVAVIRGENDGSATATGDNSIETTRTRWRRCPTASKQMILPTESSLRSPLARIEPTGRR